MKCRESTCSQITAPLHQYHPGLPVAGELPVVGHQQEAVRLGLGQHDSVEGILVGRAVLLPLEGFQRHHVPVVHRKLFEARLLAVVQELGSGGVHFFWVFHVFQSDFPNRNDTVKYLVACIQYYISSFWGQSCIIIKKP